MNSWEKLKAEAAAARVDAYKARMDEDQSVSKRALVLATVVLGDQSFLERMDYMGMAWLVWCLVLFDFWLFDGYVCSTCTQTKPVFDLSH